MIVNNSSMVPSNNNPFQPVQDVVTAPVTSAGAGYFSPFSQIRTLAELQTAGQIFAASDFAPKSFQGNVGNCMIALDVANRLGMNVLTLMQNLYIIDGKPSISTALAHSLFNMQFGKQFARIRLERGVDGTVTYDPLIRERDSRGYWTYRPSGRPRTIQNHWAIAYTTNLKTGERFESMRVSVQTANAEGWLAKYQSKWQTITELMVGYRAEAFLIRQHFPEALFGLYLREELEDIAAQKQQPTVEVIQTPQTRVAGPSPAQPKIEAAKDNETISEAESTLTNEMNAAKDMNELLAVAGKIKAQNFVGQAVDRLRALFISRKNELSQTVAQAVEVEEIKEEEVANEATQETTVEEVPTEPIAEPVEEKKTATRKPRAKKSSEPEYDANAVVARINAATMEKELAAIREELKSDEKSGRLMTELAERLGTIIENRYVDLEEAAKEAEAKDSKLRDMEANLYDLVKEVKSQQNVEGLKNVVDKAAKWRDAGDIDIEMFRQVVAKANERRATFSQEF